MLLGALLEGPADGTDSFPNVRTDNGSQVAVENNAGFSTAMVATYQTTRAVLAGVLAGLRFLPEGVKIMQVAAAHLSALQSGSHAPCRCICILSGQSETSTPATVHSVHMRADTHEPST